MSAAPRVAVVLPPREGFGPGRAGAIGLLVRRLANTPGFEAVVFGGKQDVPSFGGIDFRPIAASLWSIGGTNARYAAAVADVLKKEAPALVEVHNRPEIALAIATRLPRIPVVAFLHNDPFGMRRAATPAPRRRERLVLFAGRVVADKAPDAFISACAAALPHLPGWGAEIIGADRFSYDSPDTGFVQMIRAAAEGANIRMLGYRDHPEVLVAMSRAAIVVVPSRWAEPFGLVALEAMASGAALICSGRGGLPEVAGEAAIYADPERPNEIAAAIRALAGDEVRRTELANAGRQRARQFDTPLIAAKLAALRGSILAAAG
jgi:glycosyltransferase involved in cell wall biosynthesis